MNNLLEHNQITLNQLENYISKDQDCCVVNPCGSGKTSVMSEFIRNHKDKKIIIFTKQINAGDYYRRTDPVFEDMDIFTYNHMLNDFKSGHTDGYDADFYILDEAHYIGADKWNTAFTYLVNRFSPTIIGFTATPQRFEDQGTDETIVTEFFSGNSAGNFSSRQLQKQGVFTEPDYILSLYDLSAEIEDRMDKIELSDLNENAKARYKKMLADTLDEWEKNSRPEVILRTKLPKFLYKENNNKILVYCSRIADIASKREVLDRMLKNIFGEKVTSYRYTSKDSEKELEKFLSENDSYIKVLYSVDKIMETIHIDDLNVMIMLRPSVSNRIITQQLGRVNSIGNKNKACIIDMVDNLSNIGSVSFLNKGTGAEHGGRWKADSAADINISIDMSHLTRYKNVFDTVDNVLVRFPLYHYKGFNGSLSQICNIYNRSYTEVKELIEKGFDIEDALSRARKSNPTITPAIFAGYTELRDFSLTEEQKAETEKYIPAVERFVKNHKITDEDIIQELYMEMMYRVSKASESRYPKGFILNAINNRYAGLWRQKVIRESLYSEKNIDNIRIADGRNVEDEIFINSIKDDILPDLLKTLREREAYILNLRFGLDGGKPKTLEEVGKIIGTAKERPRQIENKALRKLRHPSRIGFICKGSEIDEVFRMYEDRNYTVEIADNAKNIAWKISG